MRMRRTSLAALLVTASMIVLTGLAHADGEAQGTAQEARVIRDADTVAGLLNAYWSAAFAAQGLTYRPPGQFHYYYTSNNDPCGTNNQPAPQNAFFCPAGNFVEFDMDWFAAELVKNPGDAHTFFILAHEWGHSAQAGFAGQQPGADTYSAGYRLEVQADCYAGAFLADAVAHGTLVAQAGDDQVIVQKLMEGGDGNFYDPATHGSPEQRVAAFGNGYKQGWQFSRVPRKSEYLEPRCGA